MHMQTWVFNTLGIRGQIPLCAKWAQGLVHLLAVSGAFAPGLHVFVLRGTFGQAVAPPSRILQAGQQRREGRACQIQPARCNRDLDEGVLQPRLRTEVSTQDIQGRSHIGRRTVCCFLQGVQDAKRLLNFLVFQGVSHGLEIELPEVLEHCSSEYWNFNWTWMPQHHPRSYVPTDDSQVFAGRC